MTSVLVHSEAKSAVRDFVSGTTTPSEFEIWLISNLDDLTNAERDALWHVRLLLVEYDEGLRPLDEAVARARELLTEGAS